jgi:hypothetical protein
MKLKALLLVALTSGMFAIPHAAFAHDESQDRRSEWSDRWSDNYRDARQLQGRWYMNGDPNRPTEIKIDGRRLEARNENGQTSRLEIDRNGNLRAADWQGIRGAIRGNSIEWNNGTTWTRRPSNRIGSSYGRWSDRDLRQLQGRWYMNGDPNRPTEISLDEKRLEARNENGQTSRLDIDRDGNIRASDWQGLRGDVRGDRIQWDNGTTWTRRPSERFSRR